MTWRAPTMTKKELLQLRREQDKLERSLGGIRDMARVPSALWVVDTKKEHIAVSEARKLGIPVIAILDTNCDPDEVTYPIPGNDDAIRSVALLTRVVADAVADGLIARAGAAATRRGEARAAADSAIGAEEPLAEWERALLEGQDTPVNGAAPAATEAPAAAAAPATEAPPPRHRHRGTPRSTRRRGTRHGAPPPRHRPPRHRRRGTGHRGTAAEAPPEAAAAEAAGRTGCAVPPSRLPSPPPRLPTRSPPRTRSAEVTDAPAAAAEPAAAGESA